MPPRRIRRQNGGTTEQVYIRPPDIDRQQHNRRHLCPECHLCHLVPMRQLNVPKSTICHPDMCIYTLLFPELNVSILMHMPRIASQIQIIIQIC